MGELTRLSNKIQNYAWGSHTTLATMRGIAAPTENPEAEVWVGAHPSGSSVASFAEGEKALSDVIAENPDRILPADRKSDSFPFLFKILAIDAPLSIQVHPTDEQALAGFAAENAAGLALDDPARNYKDQHSKPETVMALSEMKILTGVRPESELAEIAEAFELTWLSEQLGYADDRALLTSIIRMDDAAATAATETTVAKAAAWLSAHENEGDSMLARAADLIALVHEKHPNDRGLLVATVMNLIYLEPGDAAFTPDGQVHAYVSGTAIEIMNPSDNVMRAGLTPKHIDTEELIAVLRQDQSAPEIQRANPDSSAVGTFTMWDDSLTVDRIRLDGETIDYTFSGTATVLGALGKLTFEGAGESIEIGGTESLLHSGSDTPVKVSGSGEAYVAIYK